MAELTIDRTYGTALLEAARDLGKKNAILEDSNGLLELLENEPDLKTFLEYPSIPQKEKKEVMKNLFEGKVEEEFLNFLYVLVDKGRTTHLKDILKTYGKLLNEEEGFSNGTVYSVVPLSEDKIRELEEETSRLLKMKVKLTNELDSRLVGGVKVLAEGKMIDLSLRKKFDDMESQILIQGGK